jgi:sugar phosphate isomerase/epimerase
MLTSSLLSINTYNVKSLEKAKEHGFGLEIEDYLWDVSEDELENKRKYVHKLMEGFSRFSFHGTAISRNVDEIGKLTDNQLLVRYNQSYLYSQYHGISKVVFHSDYLSGIESTKAWVKRKARLWKTFLEDKPSDFRMYIENFVDDTPSLLAELHDEVCDDRFRICLDTGHAFCNSSITLKDWVTTLGRRIEHVHLHNNDKNSDKHWSLGSGLMDMADTLGHIHAYSNAQILVLECDFEESLKWLEERGLYN